MLEIIIQDADQRPLNAKVEIGDGDIIVHSRSGSGTNARSPQYRPALELILERLNAENIRPEVFLDSTPVRDQPLSQRQLASPSDLTGDPADQFHLLIRRSNAGSASRGAWRRLLLRTPPMPNYALRAILDGSARARAKAYPHGLPSSELARVQRRHLDVAIAELRGPNERPTRFDSPTGYQLLPPDGGAPLPPKKVFGIALAEALQTYTTPNDFASGERIFRIMRDRGLVIVPLAEAPLRATSPANGGNGDPSLSGIPLTDEEQSWVEGNPKVATHLRRERATGLPKSFKANFRARHGHLFCEGCRKDFLADYPAEAVEACFEAHHTAPVSQMEPDHETTFEEMQLLCANCHRVTHRKMALESRKPN